jgi:rubrerythrin
MGGKSIAARAAAIKQRQKIVYASGYMRRLENAKKDDEGNMLPSAKINMESMKCLSCGFNANYKFIRCPICNLMK